MRVWILLALAMSAVVAYPQQNQDVAVADQVSRMDSGLHNLRRLGGKSGGQGSNPSSRRGRASAAVKGVAAKAKGFFRGNKQLREKPSLKLSDSQRYSEVK
ncbi:unnamed protein product, partial [Aphanomyces euteiches]